MPTRKTSPEKLIYIYLQSREEKLIMQQKGIPVPYMSRIWLLDMAMDAIGYPPHQYDCDHFYYELYMIHPPGSNCFVNEQFSRLYWYQIVTVPPQQSGKRYITSSAETYAYSAKSCPNTLRKLNRREHIKNVTIQHFLY